MISKKKGKEKKACEYSYLSIRLALEAINNVRKFLSKTEK